MAEEICKRNSLNNEQSGRAPNLFLVILNDAVFLIALGITFVIVYTIYRVHYSTHHKHLNDKILPEEDNDKNKCRSFLHRESIISHKRMLWALEYAANNCHDKVYALECIDVIMRCPQLMNVQSRHDGLTPFHRVCLQGHSCLIAYMLARGANPFITTNKGENALCLTISHILDNPRGIDFSCLDILKNAGCQLGTSDWINSILQKAVQKNHTKLIEWLVSQSRINNKLLLRSYSLP